MNIAAQVLERFEPLTDEELVQRILAGQVELFELLMRRHNRRVYRAAWAIVRDSDEAEDIMQDAYVRAYEHLKQFRAEARFSTWLLRIAVHEALARAKQNGRWQELEEEPVMPYVKSNSRTSDPEHSAAAAEVRQLLRQVIEMLPEQQRLVFVLREVEELSTAETAEVLGLTQENVKVTLHRARLGLKDSLYAHAGSEAPTLLDFDLRRCDRVSLGVMARLRAFPPA